jgi:haloacetate dehalogenase
MTGMPWTSERRIDVGEASYFVAACGVGEPVLLLHGFPQTHRCWGRVAARLGATARVVAPDIRGYGASNAPPGGARGEGYAKREMAAELIEVMAALGHRRFAVVGHDRGARVAYRMALEHPELVTRVAVLNVVPTLDQFEHMGAGASLGYWPWFLLAQPAPFPERMIAADPAALLDHVFDTWTSRPEAIDGDSRDAYLRAMTPQTIAAMCADYRASFYLDRVDEAADRDARRRIEMPLLVVVGADEPQLASAEAVWRKWAHDVTAARVAGGHFIPEEAPDQLMQVLLAFLGRQDQRRG